MPVRSTSCSMRCPRRTAHATTSAAWWWDCWTCSGSMTRWPASRDGGWRLRSTDAHRRLRHSERQYELVLGVLGYRLQARDPNAEQAHGARRREPAQEIEGDGPDPRGGVDGLGQRAAAGMSGEVVEPDLDADRAPAAGLGPQPTAQPLDEALEHDLELRREIG